MKHILVYVIVVHSAKTKATDWGMVGEYPAGGVTIADVAGDSPWLKYVFFFLV